MSSRLGEAASQRQVRGKAAACRAADPTDERFVLPPARTPTARDRSGGALVYAVAAALGVFCGLSVFTFGYGEGVAYLQNDPRVCANCHVMQWHYDSWLQSSHRDAATCNDCHLLHDPVGKWVTKADNGFFHSLAFTTGAFPDPIRIKPRNRRVTQQACIHCHAELVDAMLPPTPHGKDMLLCAKCHPDVGHSQR